MSELQVTLRKLHSALRPGGLLFSWEYVGPNRFAFPRRETAVAERLYRALAPELRGPWPELPLPNPMEVAEADPTESIRSEEILDAVHGVFDAVDVTSLGGALAFPLWNGLNHDALFDTERGHDLVRLVLELDAGLSRAGTLPAYFAYIAARKAPAGVDRHAEPR